ncbi:MAG TPA: class I SAM-dependent methyltransferase [Longimicrobiaceae bacterium]|nr:class I SAM-dependent methyltransferase [Longimicrobiaceae bacterium]
MAPEYRVREMNLGLGDIFLYFQCPACGCLQIAELPADLSRYYPPEYYSFTRDPAARRGTRKALRKIRDRYAFTGRGLLGKMLAERYPYRFEGVREWLAIGGLTRESRILDVGCGRGELLYDMAERGYTCLTGVDPFLAEDIEYPGGPRIFSKTIHELEGSFDLIMFHHSLEHIPDQQETLRSAARLLVRGGHCLVRIPVSSSFAWELYRESWVQLDAPRHLFLHSRRSIVRLAETAGLKLARIQDDSTEFQFTGSELYRRGIPLSAARESFARGELARFRRQARKLNAQGRGDQAAFYFTRS